MAKHGVFDTSSRKIVGFLDENDSGIVNVNGADIRLEDALDAYKGNEITITVGETSDSFTAD